MGQDTGKIAKVYDTVAREYSEAFLGEHEKKPKDREILHRFVQEIGDRRPVWDFGCGPGHTAQYVKDIGVEISGLDISDNILEQARAFHPDIHFRKGNILALNFESGSIAGIISFYAIVHFTEKQAKTACREVFRVLQPGGLLLLTFHIGENTIHLNEFLDRKIDIDFMFFTIDFISGGLRECGFEQIEVIEREPYAGVEYQSRRAYVFARKPAICIAP